MDYKVLDDFEKVSDVSPETIKKYEDLLPAEWIGFWKEYGYGSFMNGYLRVIDPDEYKDFYNESVLKLYKEEAIPVMVTAFGDIIAFKISFKNDEKKWSLECAYYRYVRSTFFLPSVEHFFEGLCTPEVFGFEENFTFIKYAEAVEKLGKLKYDQCFGYEPILTKRSKEKLTDLRIVDTKAYLKAAFVQNSRIEDLMLDGKVIDVSYSAKKEKKPKRVIADNPYELKPINEPALKFDNFNFKLCIIQVLMYEKKLLKPVFDIYEFSKCYPPREINIDEEGYDPIKPAIEYFKRLEIPTSLADEIKEIIMDGGNDIYGQIIPFWDGEDEYFDLKRVSDAELSQFPNLKHMVLINSPENLGKTLLNRLKKHGIEVNE
ncbi:DUF6892 domain-containing protein [Ruminococcus albus]|uniref:GAD-related domain-containing protein n=1 Tax=Ruminococcus albus TaxID=1264 RepID=A0A1I1D429_RUMAL|nr:GAD-like domain-containing protein [Ruminococcus albus]SFB67353.1 hypothetical protein SAMN02910406_00173 [Ruminococcus albus]